MGRIFKARGFLTWFFGVKISAQIYDRKLGDGRVGDKKGGANKRDEKKLKKIKNKL